MRKLLRYLSCLCAALTILAGAPTHAQDAKEEDCQLHLWALAYVPPEGVDTQSNALVNVTSSNFADPHSSGSLLDARQRLPEIDAPSMLEHFGLSSDYKVVIHPEGFLHSRTYKKATSRMSNAQSDCYAEFALYGRTHTSGKMSFHYQWFFRDFGASDTAEFDVKGGNSGDLIRRGEEENGINTRAATAQIIENAGMKIQRRRRR